MANFISNIKIKFAYWLLDKAHKKQKRDASFQNYLTAKNIGVIFNASQQETYETAKKYIQILSNKEGIKVNALGFVNSKEVLDFYKKTNNFDYFSRKNLNWYGKPNNPNTQTFLQTKFDMLIDLSLVEDYPIQYIVALSKASFKVGCVKTNQDFYDFMIDLGDKSNLKFFIEQLERYLGMIKKA